MRGDECQRKVKLVSSARNKPKHNESNIRKINLLEKHLLKVKGIKLQRKKGTKLSDEESIDEGLYN